MTRAEYILQLAEEFKIDKKKTMSREKKLKHRDMRDVRALNKAFGAQFAAMGGTGLYKAHTAAKTGGLYKAAGHVAKKVIGHH